MKTKTDADELKELIASGGYNQKTAAAAIDVPYRTFRYYVAGDERYPVPRAVLLAMRHLVNCKPDDEGTPS